MVKAVAKLFKFVLINFTSAKGQSSTSPFAKHKRVRAISITLDLGGRKSPIRKFNLTALCSETQGAEGGRGILKGEWRNDSGFNISNRGALLPNHKPSPP